MKTYIIQFRKAKNHELERMHAGLPYKAWLDGLRDERMENKKNI